MFPFSHSIRVALFSKLLAYSFSVQSLSQISHVLAQSLFLSLSHILNFLTSLSVPHSFLSVSHSPISITQIPLSAPNYSTRFYHSYSDNSYTMVNLFAYVPSLSFQDELFPSLCLSTLIKIWHCSTSLSITHYSFTQTLSILEYSLINSFTFTYTEFTFRFQTIVSRIHTHTLEYISSCTALTQSHSIALWHQSTSSNITNINMGW